MVGMVLLGCMAGCLAGCSKSSGLSADSSCRVFIKAPKSEQAHVVAQIAAKWTVPVQFATTALGMAEVRRLCTSNPGQTLAWALLTIPQGDTPTAH